MFPSFLPKDAKSNFNSSTFTGHLWFNHVQPTFFVSLVGFETFTANIAGVSGSPGRTKLGELVPQHVLIDVRQRQHTPTKEKLGVLPTMMPYYAYVTMYWRSKYFMYITITKMKLLIFRIFPSTLRICEGFSWDASATQVWVLAGSQWDLSHPKLISSIIGVGGQFDLQARQEVSGPQPAMALWDLQGARGTGVFQNIRKIGNHLNIFE